MSGAGQDDAPRRGPLVRAFGTSILDNSQAFGFSITITVTFGIVSRADGSPTLAELFLFAVGAATVIGMVEAIVTRTFRHRPRELPAKVRMLGTSQDVISIVAALAAAHGVTHALGGSLVWPAAAALAAGVFIVTESAELLLAERIQRDRGERGR